MQEQFIFFETFNMFHCSAKMTSPKIVRSFCKILHTIVWKNKNLLIVAITL